MTKAIIFDFFGVLVLQGSDSFRLTYFPDDPEKNARVKQLQIEREQGIVDFNHFVTRVAAVGGVDRKVALKYIENYEPNVQLLKYIRDELRPKYKIGMMPNTSEDWLPAQILGLANLALFDAIVLPKTGSPEPEAETCKRAAKNLGVKTKDCVYIGYLPGDCQDAEAAGMQSMWYWGFKQIKEKFGYAGEL